MTVKLKAALPKDVESNGLGDIAEVFLEKPDVARVVILVVQQHGYHYSNETGESVPELKILKAEPVLDAWEADQLVLRAQALAGERTGHVPLDVESDDSDDDSDAEVIYPEWGDDDGGDAA